jgi:hypothetical protein
LYIRKFFSLPESVNLDDSNDANRKI